jgi:hypothetical protein
VSVGVKGNAGLGVTEPAANGEDIDARRNQH